MKRKYLIILILIISQFLIDFNFAQCTNSTTMCTSLSTSNDSLCTAGNIDINIIGGTLGPGSKWELYTGSCGGTLITTTTSNTFSNVNVSSNTTFYCKADSCDITSCVSLDVYIVSPSSDPTSLSISNDTLCSAGNVDFTVFGGSLGTNAQWELFENSCGGTPIATSTNGTFSTIPVSSSATYYVNANGYCN